MRSASILAIIGAASALLNAACGAPRSSFLPHPVRYVPAHYEDVLVERTRLIWSDELHEIPQAAICRSAQNAVYFEQMDENGSYGAYLVARFEIEPNFRVGVLLVDADSCAYGKWELVEVSDADATHLMELLAWVVLASDFEAAPESRSDHPPAIIVTEWTHGVASCTVFDGDWARSRRDLMWRVEEARDLIARLREEPHSQEP